LLEVTLAAHDLELPQPPDEEDEGGRDHADQPAEAAVKLGDARRRHVAVELQHQPRYPSRNASRSGGGGRSLAPIRRQRRRPGGGANAVRSAVAIAVRSSAPTCPTGMSKVTRTKTPASAARSEPTKANPAMNRRPRTRSRAVARRQRMQTAPRTTAPMPRGAPATTSWR